MSASEFIQQKSGKYREVLCQGCIESVFQKLQFGGSIWPKIERGFTYKVVGCMGLVINPGVKVACNIMQIS